MFLFHYYNHAYVKLENNKTLCGQTEREENLIYYINCEMRSFLWFYYKTELGYFFKLVKI